MLNLVNEGLIFDIGEFKPFSDYEFAQSPQLVRFETFNRVYFSSRRKIRNESLPISEVLYVDFDLEFESIIDYSREEILPKPILGAYDEHGIFPFHPYRNSKHEFYGYLSGWSRRISVPVETSIGISQSFDQGKTFERIGPGPVLSASSSEPFLVGDPFVIEENGLLHMFYIAGTVWKSFANENGPQRVYKIKKASSLDGIAWTKENINLISDFIGPDECQALPTVVKLGDKFVMAFCFRSAFGFRTEPDLGYKLDFALSSDLIHWERDSSFISISKHPSGWDSDMKCYPNLSVHDGKLLLLYNGNNFGKYGFGLAVGNLV
jgi:hypothetical protein